MKLKKNIITTRVNILVLNIGFILLYLLVRSFGSEFLGVALAIFYIVCTLFISIENTVYNQVILSVLITSTYDILWRKTGILVPLELKYVVDIISIILLFKIIIMFKNFKGILRDTVFIGFIIFIVVGFFNSIYNGVPIDNHIDSLRIYIRFLPIYIILSNYFIKIKKNEMIIFTFINIILFIFQIRYMYLDDRSGVFGVSNVQVLFIFLIIPMGFNIAYYLNKKITTTKFILISTLIYSIVIINETKIALVFFPIVTFGVIIFTKRMSLRMVIISISMVTLILIGIKFIPIINPQFKDFFIKENIRTNVESYLFKPQMDKYQLGRIENIFYTNNYVLQKDYEKILGHGIGSSMPSENWYYNFSESNRNRKIIEPRYSEYYLNNGINLGYHTSAANVIYLETGVVGMGIYFVICIIFLQRSINIYRNSTNISNKGWGIVGIMFIFSWIPLLFYYNFLLDRNAQIIFMIILGVNSYLCNDIKSKKNI